MTVTISYETAPTMSSRRQIQIESIYFFDKCNFETINKLRSLSFQY